MTVAATVERLEQTFAYLERRAAQNLPSPTNKEIALKALRMGKQQFQPWDRTQGIRSPKPEHGAVMIAALELTGLITVERGSNWRRITLVQSGQVLEPQKVLGLGLGSPGRPRTYHWTDKAKATATAMDKEGFSVRQISLVIGATYEQVRNFLRGEAPRKRVPNAPLLALARLRDEFEAGVA
jgi:hypothetical protein